MKVLILAGGFATRLWPLTEHRAKPLLLLDGKTILSHIVEKIGASVKSEDIFLLTNKKFEQEFKQELKNLNRENATVFCEDSFSDAEKIGALGAVSLALEHFNINENIIVIAGDNLLTEFCVSDLECGENEASLIFRPVKELHEARKFGVIATDVQGRVIDFEEKPENPKSKLVSTAFFSLGKNLLPILHDFAKKSPDALGGIFSELLNQKVLIHGHQAAGDWFDIGSFETYLEAHKAVQKDSIKKGAKTKVSQTQLVGKNFIGENSVIQNSVLIDTIVYPGCEVSHCHISNSVIDQNTILKGVDITRKLVRSNTKIESFSQK